MNKKIEVEIIKGGSKRHEQLLRNPAFIVKHYLPDRGYVYIPVGELCGVKILEKHKIKKEGMYLII